MSEHPYASERSNPAVGACMPANVNLLFDGSNLYLSGESKTQCWQKTYPAVSGKASTSGLKLTFDYTPKAQTTMNAGPIPEGKYWVNPSEMWEYGTKAWLADALAWGTPIETGFGKYRLTIHHYPTTKTHRRGGFFIHGGKVPGSIGCIDLHKHMPQFVRDLDKIVGRKACYVDLTVRYADKRVVIANPAAGSQGKK